MRRKVLLVAVLIIAILLQSVIPLTVVNASTSVEITLNSNLYKAVKSQLEQKGIAASYVDANSKIIISSDELNKVTTLDLSNKEISDLTGLSAFSKVTELNLTANELTEDSHLDELNSLSLTKLNLSSNKIESVSSISSFDSIEYTDITNQEVTQKEVITVDISEESDHGKTATVTLPSILLKDTGMIEASWLNADISGDATVDWTSIKAGSTDLVLNIATGNGESYSANKGLIKIVVDVKDSSSKLANTKMTFYYVIVDSDETGIIFEEETLYKAVKSQLTAGQKENEELTSYGESGVTLYKKAYDEAYILVMDTNTVINEVPSLILNDKRITNLTGIEEFVGLETELNVSYNYINTIEKIIELEKNKGTKEDEVQAKYSKAIETLKKNKTSLDEQKKLVKTLTEQIEAKTVELGKLKEEDQKIAKQNEINDLYKKLADANEKVNKYSELVVASENKLYKIYEKEYKLTSLLPLKVNKISVKEMLEADLSTVKDLATSILDRVSNLEKTDSLTAFENWAIQTELTSWGASNGLTFSTTKSVTKIDTDGKETTVQEPIENPISEFVATIKANPEFFTITDYEEIVYMFKCIDALAQVNNYCVIKRIATGTEDCYVEEALKAIKMDLQSKDLDTSIYDKLEHVEGCDATEDGTKDGYHLNFTAGTEYFMTIHIGLSDAYCQGSITNTELYGIGGKLASVSTEEIAEYVTLPKIQKLNIADNKISLLSGLEELKELKALNAYKNTLGKIDNVNWESFSLLKELNLGYNQLLDVKCLEKIATLEYLNVSKNLLAGNFDFYLAGLKNLKEANFSSNQYSNIAYLLSQYTFIAKGYNMNVGDYLTSSYAPKLSFQYQSLAIETTAVKSGDSITVDLPKIFAQLEQIDYARTSFGETSQNGTVVADGTAVILRTPSVGKYRGVVTVEGNNGYGDYSTEGIGFGTSCVIDYSVVEEKQEPVNPENPEDPNKPVTPDKPGDLEYGYEVVNGYVIVKVPETTIAEFVNRLVSSENYNVTVRDNKSNTNIATGSVVAIDNKENGENVALLEVVVKGDVNGDGEIDALDSGLIRSTINDTYAPVGVYESAADVNSDGYVDSLDSLLVLQYRADKIGSFED